MRVEYANIKLDAKTRESELQNIPGWEYQADQDHIRREFNFADFKKAFAFMTQVAELAELKQHHPDWFNTYSRVQINLRSHEIDAVSQLDIDMARAIDAVYEQ